MSRVRFRLPDGTTAEVGEGGLIGRAATAQLRLDDPSVSEAHALVSLRGRELRVLALRGRVLVNDAPVAEATLRARQRVGLGPNVVLVVEEVEAGPAAVPVTPTAGEPGRAVRIELADGWVSIREGEDPPLVLGGNQAELVRMLAEAEEPIHWREIARWFWPERDQPRWRERFDATVKEVRAKLRDHRVRADLVWSWDGSYRLHLRAGDEVTRGR